jgi:hypothetical protein
MASHGLARVNCGAPVGEGSPWPRSSRSVPPVRHPSAPRVRQQRTPTARERTVGVYLCVGCSSPQPSAHRQGWLRLAPVSVPMRSVGSMRGTPADCAAVRIWTLVVAESACVPHPSPPADTGLGSTPWTPINLTRRVERGAPVAYAPRTDPLHGGCATLRPGTVRRIASGHDQTNRHLARWPTSSRRHR